MFETYIERARQVIFFAYSEACELGSLSIESGHMLLGLLRADERLTNHFLHSAVSVELIRKQIEGHTPLRERTPIDQVDPLSVGQLPLSDECQRIIAFTAEEAERLGDERIGTEHLLLGIMREENCLAAHWLKERGVQLDAVRDWLANLLEERKREANRVLKVPNLRHAKPAKPANQND